MLYECKECGENFKSQRSLHTHIKKHELTLGEYYVKNYPRYNLLNGNLLPFKNKEDYFNNDFTNRKQLNEWCLKESPEKVKPYIIRKLRERIEEKDYANAPFHLELENRMLPSIDIYKKFFESYTYACKEAESKPIFKKNIPKNFFNEIEDFVIFVDSREQKPLNFPKMEKVKLDFGDYTLGKEEFNNCFIERKSAMDFASTFGQQIDRFEKEMQRAEELGSYIFILVEKTIPQIKKEIFFKKQNTKKIEWILSNMFYIQHKYFRNCQFVFLPSRQRCEEIAPNLLYWGPLVKNVDLQYFIEQRIEE